MKHQWQRIALKIDALTLRERTVIFGMVALIVIVLVNSTLLDPRFAEQNKLSKQIKQDRAVMAGLQAQIQQRTEASELDPDKANKQALQALKEQIAKLQGALVDQEKAMVSPDRMSALLEDILSRNHGLRLISLKNMEPSPFIERAQAEEKQADNVISSIKGKLEGALKNKPEASAASSVYKHGVEIVVQGGYLDLMNYLAQLEAMPWQLLWAKVKLDVDQYPRSTLTLTLYTLSLDKKWLNL